MRFQEIRALYFKWEYPLDARMYFQLLQRRLVEALRRLIGNGLMTERGLARWAGISQPHMHHILKGTRGLSPQVADRLLHTLQLTVIDLLELAEMPAQAGNGGSSGASDDRIQTRVDEVRALWERDLLPAGPERRPRKTSVAGAWPLHDRFPEPGAPPPPS